MVSDPGRIGLVAWGLKLGKQVFFGNGVVDPLSPEIENTMEDARGIIHMLHTRQVFYSFECTSRFKVFTIYRTLIDWGNRDNAYLAISLFVPFDLEIEQGVIRALKELVGIYDENYIDDNQQIKRTQEKRELFFDKLNSFTTKESISRPPGPGATGYAYLRYDGENELGRFFENPFLEEFAPYKEIYFLEKGNEKIKAVSELRLLEATPRDLFRTIHFRLQNTIGGLLEPPFTFMANSEDRSNHNMVELKILAETPEIRVRVEKTGYEPFSATLSKNDPALMSGEYLIQLKERERASLVVWDEETSNPLPKIKIRVDNMFDIETDGNGKYQLKDYFAGDRLRLIIDASGYEKFDQSEITLKSTTYIPLKKIAPPPAAAEEKAPATTPQDIAQNKEKEKGETRQPRDAQQATNAAAGQQQAGEIPKKSLKKLWRIVLFSTLGVVLVVLGILIVSVLGTKQKLNKQREALRNELYGKAKNMRDGVKAVKDSLGAIREDELSKISDSLFNDFVRLQEDVKETLLSFESDSARFIEKIEKLEDIKKTAPLKIEITEGYDQNQKELNNLTGKISSLKIAIGRIQDKVQSQKEKKALDNKRLERLEKMATGMCYEKTDSINAFIASVEKLEISRAEKNRLIGKFKLIKEMVIAWYNGSRKPGRTFDDVNSNLQKLKDIQKDKSGQLSQDQRKWLENKLKEKWSAGQ